MECKFCGCTDGRACVGGCSWVKTDVCSQCAITKTAAKRFLDSAEEDIELKSGELKFLVIVK